MKNTLRDRSNHLATIDYTKVLQKAQEKVGKIDIQSTDMYMDFNNINSVIKEVMNELKAEHGTVFDILDINPDKKPKHITLNHKDYEVFTSQIEKLAEKLQVQSPDKSVLSTLGDLKKQDRKRINFGVTYPFDDKQLFRKMVSFTEKDEGEERLRVDEVELKIDLKEIQGQLKTSIINLLKQECEDEDVLEEKIEKVEQGKYRVDKVINLLNDESLARIKRTVSYLYLEYLLSSARDKKSAKYSLACNYIKRFKLLEQYLKELVIRPDEEGKVQIGMRSYDLCDVLSEGNAFDALPFVGKVDGMLLEDRDAEQKTFKFALRMKLNGSVQKEGSASSLVYHIDAFRGEKKNNKNRLRTFFLYTFMLVNLRDESFDPIANWKKIKKMIDSSSFEEVAEKFVDKHQKSNSELHIVAEEMKGLFTDLIKYRASGLQCPSKVYSRNLILYRGIMETDLESPILFKKVEYEKEYLKYVSVVEDEGPSEITLLNMPITITIQSRSLYEKGDTEKTKLAYQLDGISVLPVVLYPDIPKKAMEQRLGNLWQELKQVYHIRIPYVLTEKEVTGEDGLLYSVIYTMVVYLLIYKVLKDINGLENKCLYIPINRVHSERQQNEAAKVGEYIRNISKVLEHLLAMDYRAMSQGFVYDKAQYKEYAYLNAASSMYNRVTKTFKQPEGFKIDKAAIIVVTSRKCDNSEGNSQEISLLVGEVILFDKDQEGNMACDSWKTFADYYRTEDFYQKPRVLSDVVNELYQKGYMKIIYIAKAPYSSKLNITNQIESKFFMNEEIIEMMKVNKQGLMIYPLYFEQFSAVDYKGATDIHEALYVSNTSEIDYHLTNNSQSIAGVLNVYSGKAVGSSRQKEGKYYRSVMLYSTLCNMYQDKQTNAALLEGLVSETTLKQGLVEILIMLHYARYEADKSISIKINPYERLIGDDSVAARGVLTFEYDRLKEVNFNTLAYLTDIKKILDKE